jgi:NadR type nicotinamide-nucleotide adenylyltransferase
MVLGKFMPPHLGHVYLFDFAQHYVDELAIVVDSLKNQPIPGELRYQWVREMFPDALVLHLAEDNPQEPAEDPEFWQIWHDSLTRILPFKPDYLFASEEYGWKLSEVMDAQFVPVDIDRTIMPVSGTAVCEDPLSNWQYLPRVVRPYFAKRVCIFGPESTGKSTLARKLAEHYASVFVPEYARTHIESRNGDISLDDISMIARGQMASEDAIAFNANRVLFCDTDLVTTTIWSKWLFQSCPEWIEAEANQRQYDLYLVTDVDVPWVEDSVRYLPNERKSFLDRCIEELEKRDRNYIVLSGNWEKRLTNAIAAVDEVLDENS